MIIDSQERILRAIENAYPGLISNARLVEKTGISSTSRFSN